MSYQAAAISPLGTAQAQSLPPWLQKSLPWLVSITFHLGLFLIVAFIFYATRQAMDKDADNEVVIPTSFTDPALSPTPGPTAPGTGHDPSRDAAQDNLKDVLKSDGWSQNNSLQNVAGLLEGQTAQADIDFIARGTGGSTGAGAAGSGDAGGGAASPYGTPGGSGGPGFKSSFYGTGGNATRIVYIIDHSGSMMDNFDYLKVETKRSVNQLVPLQFFSVIMVSDTASVVGIPQLQRATDDKKREFIAKLDDYVAEGQNDDLLPPFQEAFEKAFAMRPQLIYFLTDGHFDPRLADVVQQLNRQRKVHINTLAFVNHEASYEDQLQNLAKKNGGVYKFISERDAQGQ
jgi:hypothetical protein